MLSLTAIVPTCNRSVLLERALRSIAAQELAPTEIVVVDDSGKGGEEASRLILRRCGLRNARVVANSRSKGASGARNTGAAHATGKLLAFLDDDDEWLPSYLAEASRIFTSSQLDVLGADLLCRFNDGADRPGKTAPDRLLPQLFLTRNPGLGGSNLILKRALYWEIDGFNELLPALNDMDLGIRLSLRAGIKYGRLPKRLVRFHQHTGPKLCTVKGDAMRVGIRRFYEIHSHQMTEAQRQEFRQNVRFFWGINELGVPDDHSERFLEPLLPFLKARLDEKRRQIR